MKTSKGNDGSFRASTVPKMSQVTSLDCQLKGTLPISVNYTNYRGENADRTIIPQRLYWGATKYHPEPQWLLEAWDQDRQAIRVFALRDMKPIQLPT